MYNTLQSSLKAIEQSFDKNILTARAHKGSYPYIPLNLETFLQNLEIASKM